MKWALIGASRIAANYMVDAIREGADGEIVAVLSSDAERGAAFARDHGIARAYTDLETLLANADCDAVYISTTNEKHFAQAMAAIAAKKHVVCEKPLAMTLSDAVTMVRAAQDAGLAFATNHHLRNAGSHHAIGRLIASGRVGKVLSMRVFHAVGLPEELQGWRINDAAAGGGVIPDITVHDADTVRFHLGEDPVSVVATAGTSGLGAGVEDSVMSVWTMPSGAMVSAHESFTHRFAGTGLEVHGTEGSIFARNVMTQEPIGEIKLVDAAGTHEIPFETHNLYHRAMALFADAMRGEGPPAASGTDGIKSLAIALAVREAAQTGASVHVDYAGV